MHERNRPGTVLTVPAQLKHERQSVCRQFAIAVLSNNSRRLQTDTFGRQPDIALNRLVAAQDSRRNQGVKLLRSGRIHVGLCHTIRAEIRARV